jgi:PQQ-dependent catabolism-associated CXXCW motif protein
MDDTAASGVPSRFLLALAILACTAAAPEPPGLWTGPTQSPVPATITGGTTIHTAALQAMLAQTPPVLVDVASAPRRPPTLSSNAPWMPVPHRDIPGSVWIPGAGLGIIPAALETHYRQQLQTLTHGDPNTAIVIYCHTACWLSWNAAKRAITYGYHHVFWYPDGIEGWISAAQPTQLITPVPE